MHYLDINIVLLVFVLLTNIDTYIYYVLCVTQFCWTKEFSGFCMLLAVMSQESSLSNSVFLSLFAKKGNLDNLIIQILDWVCGGIYGWGHIIINDQIPDGM